MARKALVLLSLITGFTSLIVVHVYCETNPLSSSLGHHFHEKLRRTQEFKASFIRRDLLAPPTSAPTPAAAPAPLVIILQNPNQMCGRVFHFLREKIQNLFLMVVMVMVI